MGVSTGRRIPEILWCKLLGQWQYNAIYMVSSFRYCIGYSYGDLEGL
jgi:hypothetical protein